MLNIEKYREDLKEKGDGLLECNIHFLMGEMGKSYCMCFNGCRACRKECIEWLLSEYKEPILTEEERKYLSAVIEPFKKYVMYIAKLDFKVGWEKIVFYSQSFKTWECMTDLPPFQSGTRFKGMELNEHYYKLEELGL